jgi:esterase/lipase superfamily enzyme
MYSWPSGDQVFGYSKAEIKVEKTWPRFAWFLKDIFQKSGAKNIYLVAHSMGNRAAVKALSELATHHGLGPNESFKQVILAAADVATNDFSPLENSIRAITNGLTVYGSDGDVALSVSNYLHQTQRLGEGISHQKIYSGMDSIDATQVAHGVLGHGYIIQNERVVLDLRGLINGVPVNARPQVRPASNSSGTFWNLLP